MLCLKLTFERTSTYLFVSPLRTHAWDAILSQELPIRSPDRFRVRKPRRNRRCRLPWAFFVSYRISSEIQHAVEAAARDGPEVSVTALQGSFQGRL